MVGNAGRESTKSELLFCPFRSLFFCLKKVGKKRGKSPNLAPGALDVERQHAQRRQPRPFALRRVRDQIPGVDVRLDLAMGGRRVRGGRLRGRGVHGAGADPAGRAEAVPPPRQRHPAAAHDALVDHEPQRVEHVGLVRQESPRTRRAAAAVAAAQGQAGLHDAARGRDEVRRRERDPQEGLEAPRGVPHDRLLHLHGHREAEAGLRPA